MHDFLTTHTRAPHTIMSHIHKNRPRAQCMRALSLAHAQPHTPHSRAQPPSFRSLHTHTCLHTRTRNRNLTISLLRAPSSNCANSSVWRRYSRAVPDSVRPSCVAMLCTWYCWFFFLPLALPLSTVLISLLSLLLLYDIPALSALFFTFLFVQSGEKRKEEELLESPSGLFCVTSVFAFLRGVER